MSKKADLVGARYGRLVVVEYSHSKNGQFWRCMCDCGGTSVVSTRSLNYGSSRSCGCGSVEQAISNCIISVEKKRVKYPHAMKLRDMLKNMKARCYNPKNKRFEHYGARGIKVCEEWLTDSSAFYKWAHENGHGAELTIDRIDVDKDYSPENCRFADAVTQMNNTTRNRYIEWNGQRKTLAEWSRIVPISQFTLKLRLDAGWSIEKTMTHPVRQLYGPRT